MTFPAALIAADQPPAMAVPLEGAAYEASLMRVEPEGRIMLGVDGRPRTVAAESLVRWGAPATPAAGGMLVLAAGGSRLPVDTTFAPLMLKEEKVVCDTSHLGRLSLPLSTLRGVILRVPVRPLDADLLANQLMTADGNSDQVLLDNGDRLSGTVMELGLEKSGAESTVEKLKLEVEGRALELEARNIAAIVFNPKLVRGPAQPNPRETLLMVGLADGTRLACTRAASEGTTLKLTTREGLKLSTSLANVVWFQPLSRQVVYLSDLGAAGFKHTPYLSLAWPYHRDRNVLGGELRSGGRAWLKGLGMHSTSLLSYTLDKPYRRLDAELAIDETTAGRGSVIFRVYVDTGDGKWQRRYESPVIRGGEKPTPISVDLAGAKRIGLLVDLADRGDELDHANWLDARLVR